MRPGTSGSSVRSALPFSATMTSIRLSSSCGARLCIRRASESGRLQVAMISEILMPFSCSRLDFRQLSKKHHEVFVHQERRAGHQAVEIAINSPLFGILDAADVEIPGEPFDRQIKQWSVDPGAQLAAAAAQDRKSVV